MGLRGVFRANQSASIPKKIDTDFGTDLPSEVSLSGISVSSEPVSIKSSKGRKWTFLGGTWGVVSNKLVATSAASSYPVVSTDAKVKDVSIELRDISNGAGASLWVTDSGNWWGIGVYQDQTSCNCSSCQDYACTGYGCTGYGCTGYGCTGYGCTGYGCTGYGCTSSGCLGTGCTGYGCKGYGVTGYSFCGTADRPRFCANYGCSGGYGCTGYGCNGGYGCKGYGCTSSGCTSNGCTSEGCTSSGCTNSGCTSGYYYNYACNCQTCYPAYIRVIKSVANSVTTVTTWAVSSVVKSIRVKTKGKDIVVQSFSDANLASAIQTDTYTASEATPTTKFGLIVNPSNYDEQKSMSKIKIERNK